MPVPRRGASSRPNGKPSAASRAEIRRLFRILEETYGPQLWWPADTDFEVIVGAILTQNTAWTNVERAIANLKSAALMDAVALSALSESELAEYIRPAGTYRVKARRLRSVVEWLMAKSEGDVRRALRGDVSKLRHELLSLHGVGPETADAMLLYAGHRPSFVIDAYTRRVWRRHLVIRGDEPYDAVRALAMEACPPSVGEYQEHHALLVWVAKVHCRTQANCRGCPLERRPHDASL